MIWHPKSFCQEEFSLYISKASCFWVPAVMTPQIHTPHHKAQTKPHTTPQIHHRHTVWYFTHHLMDHTRPKTARITTPHATHHARHQLATPDKIVFVELGVNKFLRKDRTKCNKSSFTMTLLWAASSIAAYASSLWKGHTLIAAKHRRQRCIKISIHVHPSLSFSASQVGPT